MLILSVGLPKSGSAWYYNLTNDLIAAGGGHDARVVRQRYDLHPIMKFGTCNIQEPTEEKLLRLTSPPVSDFTFAVKTHHPPTRTIIDLIESGKMKVSYIYRDPRDIAVSVFEESLKFRNQGRLNRGVTSLHTICDAILWAETWLRNSWDCWKVVDKVLHVRYEDLLSDSENELKRLGFFLCFDLEAGSINKIIDKWRPEQLGRRRDGDYLHFNKGLSGRFRSVMNAAELRLAHERFGTYLKEMGYPV